MSPTFARRFVAEFTGTGVSPARTPGSRRARWCLFIAAQIIGGALGTLLAVIVYPVRRSKGGADTQAQLAG